MRYIGILTTTFSSVSGPREVCREMRSKVEIVSLSEAQKLATAINGTFGPHRFEICVETSIATSKGKEMVYIPVDELSDMSEHFSSLSSNYMEHATLPDVPHPRRKFPAPQQFNGLGDHAD